MVNIYFSLLVIGLILVSALIILGSIASRKFNFNFSYLSILSLGIYFCISFLGTKMLTPIAGITLVGMIGLFEATIGLKLIVKFKANLEDLDDEIRPMLKKDYTPPPSLVGTMVLIYMIIGWLGTLFA